MHLRRDGGTQPRRSCILEKCNVNGCERPVHAGGFCSAHYSRLQRTGDPEGIRRFYAPQTACARDGCDQPVKLYKARPRKYCSPECYSAGRRGKDLEWQAKTCTHCAASYVPCGTKQRYCWDCLGEPVVYKNGVRRYPGGRLLMLYGLSWPEWKVMVARFAGACWICKDRSATVVDHDHDTGRVRGALCALCNTRLHRTVDDLWLKRAMEYLAET